jgi:hypothetical protein
LQFAAQLCTILALRGEGGGAMTRPVESTEEFKLRIAAKLRDKREHIAGAPRPHPLLLRRKKQATYPKGKRRTRR